MLCSAASDILYIQISFRILNFQIPKVKLQEFCMVYLFIFSNVHAFYSQMGCSEEDYSHKIACK